MKSLSWNFGKINRKIVRVPNVFWFCISNVYLQLSISPSGYGSTGQIWGGGVVIIGRPP
jgi:hypothetical protein